MFKGSSVYIRILEEEDIRRTHRWINTEEIINIMGFHYPKCYTNQIDWFNNSVKNNNSKFIFVICLKETDEHIGNVALGNIDYINRNAMLSIFIYEEKHRGKSYGQQAVYLILKFAFKNLNLHKVYLRTTSTYSYAINFYKQLGFKEEGYFKEHEYKDGIYVDKIYLGILKADFLKYNNFV